MDVGWYDVDKVSDNINMSLLFDLSLIYTPAMHVVKDSRHCPTSLIL